MWVRRIPLIAAALALGIILTVPDAFAQEGPPNHTIVNRDSTHVYDATSGTWTASLGELPRTPDQYGNWVNHVVEDSANAVTVRTGANTLVFDKGTCSGSFIDGDGGSVGIYSDSYKPYRKANGTTNWIHVSTVTNAQCVVTVINEPDHVEVHGMREIAGVGRLVVKYIKHEGEYWKSQLEPTNLSALTNQHFGLRQTIEVPRTIQFGGQDRDLANFNGTTFDRAWLENNKARLLDFKNNISFDFDLGWQHLESVTVSYLGGDRAFLTFDYFRNTHVILPNQTFVIDPTFGYTAESALVRVLSNAATGVSCNNSPYGKNTVGATVLIRASSGAALECRVLAAQWNTSTIPDDSIIIDTSLRYDINAVSNAINCDYNEIQATHDITTADATTLWNDINNVANGTTYISNSASCTTVATNKVLDLGTDADADLQAALSLDRFAVGFTFFDKTRGASINQMDFVAGQNELQVTYIGAPDPPSGFAAESTGRQVDYSWVQTQGTGITGYYIERSLDNSTYSNSTAYGNVTSATDTAYYRPGLLYFVKVLGTFGTGNTTADYASFTMDDYPDAPGLVTPMEPVSGTEINATSIAGASSGGDAVDDFGLQCEINNTGGWQTVVANSTIPWNREYTISGYWTTGDVIICQWRDGNDVGWSEWSNNATYPARPDAVTTLTVISVFQTTAEISWTEPNLHGLALIGYQVNFTSPWGIPLTVIATTNSSETEYSIIGLQNNTQYSFRVSAITGAGVNATGNIVNILTPTDFTPGDIDLDATNPLRFPIRFERTDINSTSSSVEVIYDDEMDLDCTMYFEFAQQTQEFDSLNGTEYSDDEDSVTFYFNNPENEVITINCYDSADNSTTSTFQMIQSAFPLLDVINNFRTGEYGTMGQFGPLDLITVFVVIISMIGFNRTNPAVGAIFCFIIIGVTASFGIIQWYSAMTGLIATILMLAIASVRKDD